MVLTAFYCYPCPALRGEVNAPRNRHFEDVGHRGQRRRTDTLGGRGDYGHAMIRSLRESAAMRSDASHYGEGHSGDRRQAMAETDIQSSAMA
jgi:hypothetical protein